MYCIGKYGVHFTLYIDPSAVSDLKSKFYRIESTVYIIEGALYSLYNILYITHCTFLQCSA